MAPPPLATSPSGRDSGSPTPLASGGGARRGVRDAAQGLDPSGDAAELDSPPKAKGVRLVPPGDPYLQEPNRPLLAPDSVLRKRLFRPLASPGAVLRDGRLAGLWRVKAKGKKAEITVEKLERIARAAIEEEVQRVADLRGASDALLVLN